VLDLNLILGILFAILSLLGFGFVDFLVGGSSKRLGAYTTSLWLLLTRVVLLILLIPFLLSYISPQPFLIPIILLTAIAGIMGALGLSKGMRVGNISIISPITAIYPVITIFLSLLFLNEPITAFQSLCIVLIVLGTILVSLNLKNMMKSGARKMHLGIEFALISALGWGLFFFFMTILTAQIGWFESSIIVAIPQLCFLLLYGYLTRERFSVPQNMLPRLSFLGVLALLGLVGFNLGVTYTYAVIVTPISAASIVITVVLAVVLLKEKLESYQKLGMLMVILGVILVSI